MKKLALMLATLALLASCTQSPPRCSRDGRPEPAVLWDIGLHYAEILARFDATNSTEGAVSTMQDLYKDWEADLGTESAKHIVSWIGKGLMEIAEGKCGGTPSQQRTAKKIFDRLRTVIGFG